MHHGSVFRSVCLQAVDLSKPIDKRIYKGTQPTCHDFNQYSATAESVALIVGFSAGQVQYLDPIKKETSKLFNEEVLYVSVRTRLLCLKPSSIHQEKFVILVSIFSVFPPYPFFPSLSAGMCQTLSSDFFLFHASLFPHSFTVSSELPLSV